MPRWRFDSQQDRGIKSLLLFRLLSPISQKILKFFRSIRQNFINENKTAKYLEEMLKHYRAEIQK